MLQTQEISNFVHDLVFRALNHYIFHDENGVSFTSGNLVTKYLTICGQLLILEATLILVACFSAQPNPSARIGTHDA